MKKEVSPTVVAVIIVVVVVVIIVVGFFAVKGKKTDAMPQNATTLEDMANLGKGKMMGQPGQKSAPGGTQMPGSP